MQKIEIWGEKSTKIIIGEIRLIKKSYITLLYARTHNVCHVVD